jgi:hypothetical protein
VGRPGLGRPGRFHHSDGGLRRGPSGGSDRAAVASSHLLSSLHGPPRGPFPACRAVATTMSPGRRDRPRPGGCSQPADGAGGGADHRAVRAIWRPLNDTPMQIDSQARNTTSRGALRGPTTRCCGFAIRDLIGAGIHTPGGSFHVRRPVIPSRRRTRPPPLGWLSTGPPPSVHRTCVLFSGEPARWTGRPAASREVVMLPPPGAWADGRAGTTTAGQRPRAAGARVSRNLTLSCHLTKSGAGVQCDFVRFVDEVTGGAPTAADGPNRIVCQGHPRAHPGA